MKIFGGKAGMFTLINDKDKIFSILCRHCCSIMDGWIPYPSTCIHEQIPSITLYAVRKHLKTLKQEGLIDSDLYVDQGEERPILIRGWVVTKEGMKTNEYKLAHEIERQICKDCFDIDIGDVKTEFDNWLESIL
jgi:NMD protein affecting ribosome stability and mRNA decay